MGTVDFVVSPSQLSFFGLSLEIAGQYKKHLKEEIHEIVFHGQGGYDWETVENLPIWVRKMVFDKMKKFYTKQSESSQPQSSTQTTLINPDGTVNKEKFKALSKNYKPTINT
jgi:hypothetical protein